MNLAQNLSRSAAARPQGVAVRLGDASLSYAQLDELSGRVASLLRARGLAPGDRVGVMLPNILEFATVYYGVLRAGCVVVPMNPLLKTREVAYYLADSGARLMVASTPPDPGVGVDTVTVDDRFPSLLAGHEAATDVVERDGVDTAVILYTSGTTGQPKGAELTHANLIANAEVTAVDLLQLTPDDVIFGGLPLFHSFGQTCTLNTAVATGATLTLLPRFDPAQALALVAAHGATVFAGVPTMYSAMLQVPADQRPDTHSLRVCVSGGAALPVEVLRRFESEFGCIILEGYGLSETSPVASFNHPGVERKPGSIGTPIRGVEMRVVDGSGEPVAHGDVGEIAIRGHNIMKGYWHKPEATREAVSSDGWFRTGDMGRADDDGYYYIVDRKKDLIIRGGYNVYPREVEEVLYEHPAVGEAAVIGIPHPDLGEEVAAVVVLRPGAHATSDELVSFVKDQVAPYKYPRQVWLVEALPKTATGKILKREIVLPGAAVTS